MMLGTIWYILFNVISGASAIPQDLRACTQLTHLDALADVAHALAARHFPRADHRLDHRRGRRVERQHRLRIRAVSRQHASRRTGLGALISDAQDKGNFPLLAAAVLAMALFVVFFNRLVWKRLSAIAQERFQLLT